jgi:hypothetical protein
VHTSIGTVKYDPNHSRSTFKPWWVIVQCDQEIVRYYQHIFYKLYFKKLQSPLWGSHISLVRQETPKIKKNWKLYDGQLVKFNYSYDGEFFSNQDSGGKHFWIKVYSDEFTMIRKSLGLAPAPFVQYHISIGSMFSG